LIGVALVVPASPLSAQIHASIQATATILQTDAAQQVVAASLEGARLASGSVASTQPSKPLKLTDIGRLAVVTASVPRSETGSAPIAAAPLPKRPDRSVHLLIEYAAN